MLTVQTTAQLRGGSLSGSGTITGSVSNNATLSPGASPGLLAITGTYTEGSGAHLQIELGGTTPTSSPPCPAPRRKSPSATTSPRT
jgi:hypothetical protein